jgi:predicted metal-dependent hydrolase
MQRTTTYGRRQLAYAYRESPNRRTMAIQVSKEAGIEVIAPKGTDPSFADAAVQEKGRWLMHQLRDLEAMESPPPARTFHEGESFPYLGRNHQLRYVNADNGLEVKLKDGALTVWCARDQQGTAPVAKAIESWYRRRAKEVLAARIKVYAERLGVPVPEVRVRKQAARWASCTPAGAILVNWQVIGAPSSIVDYVLAHEVVHLKHANHGRAFQTALARVMPDYQDRARQLERDGATYAVLQGGPAS